MAQSDCFKYSAAYSVSFFKQTETKMGCRLTMFGFCEFYFKEACLIEQIKMDKTIRNEKRETS